jgi:hypothetical protein
VIEWQDKGAGGGYTQREMVWEGEPSSLPASLAAHFEPRPHLMGSYGTLTIIARRLQGKVWTIRWSWMHHMTRREDRLRETRRSGYSLPYDITRMILRLDKNGHLPR